MEDIKQNIKGGGSGIFRKNSSKNMMIPEETVLFFRIFRPLGKVIFIQFTKELPAFFTSLSPLIVKGMCIVHMGGKETGEIIAFDLKTGKKKWECNSDGPSYASLSLMTVNSKKQIVDLTAKNLVGIDPEDGKLLWKFAVPAQ